MNKYHVLTDAAARRLGIIDAAGNSKEHDASYADIERAAESSHESNASAYDAAHSERADGRDRWIIDPSGDSHFVGGASS
jgi:hypothetical protein